MKSILSLLIVTTFLAAPNSVSHSAAPKGHSAAPNDLRKAAEAEERHPDAVEVFACGFEESWDKNFDGWPDFWKREIGTNFPHYVEIKTSDESPKKGKQCLKIAVNGGAATVHSPPIPVRSLFSYVLEGYVRIEGIERDEVYLTVTLYDEAGKELDVSSSPRMGKNDRWQKINIGPITSTDTTASYATISLHLTPTARPDLKGAVYLDDVWFARLPRMVLKTNSPHNVYTEFDKVEVTCEVSGILDKNPDMKFEVVDASSRAIASSRQRLEGRVVAEKSSSASELFGTSSKRTAGFAGETRWKPPIKDYGYYQIRVSMFAKSTGDKKPKLIDERSVSVAIVRPEPIPANGEFGWTLPDGDNPVPLIDLEKLLTHVGINWLKFPVWYSVHDNRRADQLVRFAERLSLSNIELVGLLHKPPPELVEHFGDSLRLAADIFSSDSKIWQPSLEPVMARLSLKIRWWQLGLDQDISFVNYPDLANKIEEIKRELYSFGQEVFLGIGWRWINEELPEETPPWRFLSFSASPSLTPKEIETYLGKAGEKRAQRWVVIEPLRRGDYSNETRATDLIHRMLSAKIAKADAIFIPNPFNTMNGLMNDDGTPGELLLPWRTTALALSGAEYLGSIRLPGGSQNHVFTKDGKAIMVIWNDRPGQEVIYLGENLTMTDIWGRESKLKVNDPDPDKGYRQAIPVGPLPVFIHGVNESITRMRMSFRFSKEQLPSVFDKAHEEGVEVENFFRNTIDGTIHLSTPKKWEVPEDISLQLAGGEQNTIPFEITLPIDSSSGIQDIVAEFRINADREYRFSVYRDIEIGLGDVMVEATTRLNDQGDLEVEQRIINETDDLLSFKCVLFATNRKKKRTQVLDLGRGDDIRTYRLKDGNELVGTDVMIRIEEVNGQRTLNTRIKVKE